MGCDVQVTLDRLPLTTNGGHRCTNFIGGYLCFSEEGIDEVFIEVEGA